MKKVSFNDNWRCHTAGGGAQSAALSLPHDALQTDLRTVAGAGGKNNGWYNARDYIYEKKFSVPSCYPGQRVILEFEGVYHKAAVFVDNREAARHSYGYTGFYIDITQLLSGEKEEHTVRLEVTNSDQPNCRWYSGTGPYRPAWLYVLPENHILIGGCRVTTLDYEKRKVQVEAAVSGAGNIRMDILDGGRSIASWEGIASQEGDADGLAKHVFELPQALLWSPEQPKLYSCKIRYEEDEREETFGIRQVGWNAEEGFLINGSRVILRGACIHHDNGLLGARAYAFAEQRKIRLLKENGYNAVRSAHNPCSKAMLEACDRLGMLVLDEYVDVWYIHKNLYDYAGEVEENYPEDLRAMVEKDYNHPSVIMYSVGNEVSETGQKRGIDLCGRMTAFLHELDATRPVTCGINIFFNFLSSVGFGVYSDRKARKEVRGQKKKASVGSEFFNDLAGRFGAGFMKFGATLYPCDVKTRDAFSRLDIAGYNYGINRYQKDLKKYPRRLILGSETFCADAFAFWELAKKQKRIIGDFVWAGMDYLGEVGVGSWEYKDYAPDQKGGAGWVSAGSGRIDLTGRPLAEAAYTRVAFEQCGLGLAVVPVHQYGRPHSPSAWKMTNALESWSWHGCGGKKTKVEVYARAHRVALFLNQQKVGEKRIKGDCRVSFPVIYADGDLEAVAYDAAGRETARKRLSTAGEETVLSLEPEQNRVGTEELCYIRMRVTDRAGILKPMERGEITIHVQGGEVLGFGNACPYHPRSYLSNTADTYYGEALAIVKPLGEGAVRLCADSPWGKQQIEVMVEG